MKRSIAGRCAIIATRLVIASAFLPLGLLRAETLIAIEDAFVNSDKPSTNFGSDTTISVAGARHIGFVKFDLSSLSQGDVASATLRLYVSQLTRAGDFSVSEVRSAWNEGTLTYNNKPILNQAPEAISAVGTSDNGNYVDIDLTALAMRWLSGSANNNGVALQRNGGAFNVRFASSESNFKPELIIILGSAAKPNFATVRTEGGDYSDPIAAIDDREEWCDVSSLSGGLSSPTCQLLVGPGTFHLPESLKLPLKFDVIGAGSSGSQRTELVAQPGVDAVIELISDRGSKVISDLHVRNSGGANGIVRGIWSDLRFDDSASVVIRNVSVDVAGGAADATTGIQVGIHPLLDNVDVSVRGGATALGIFTNCVLATDVHVRVESDSNAQSVLGWHELSDDCRHPSIVRFDILSRGSNATGIFLNDRGGNLMQGTIDTTGIGIRNDEVGLSHLSNLRIAANTAIRLTGDAVIDNVSVDPFFGAVTALDMRESFGSARVTNSTLIGDIVIGGTFGAQATLRIDSSSIEAISVDADASVFIGSSKVKGPIVAGAGQLTCIDVYDENYQPVTCN